MELKTLCELQGTSGHEEQVRAAIAAACRELKGVTVEIDRAGNVIATKKGRAAQPKRLMLCAHMDEVGLMVISYTDDGLLRVRAIGGIDSRVLVSKRVLVGEKKLAGVIGAMAIHLQTAEDRKTVLPVDQLYVDIGAKDKAEAERLAPLGAYITFATPFENFGDGLYLSKALDDRVGCYNLLRLLEGEYDATAVCVFTTQEEVGARGATGAAYRIQPDTALILEGTAANDMGDVPQTARVCTVGEGVCVSFMDGASIARPDMFAQVTTLAREKGIAYQVKRGTTGGNEGGCVQRTGSGVKTCLLSVPCRYIHSPSSVCAQSDVDAQYALAKAYLESMK